MRGTVAKRLRSEARKQTIGRSKMVTRKFYQWLKKQYKAGVTIN